MMRGTTVAKTSLPALDIRTRAKWRAWLAKHHASSEGVWLVTHKKHTGVPSVPYDDAVREALCFGWIDSLVKRLDDDRYLQKYTPRKPGSFWSDSNRKRWAELKAEGLLAPAGVTAAPTDKQYPPKPKVPEMPAYFAAALRANPKARTFFDALSRMDRRYFVVWVHLAKRPETRRKRLRESVRLLTAGKKLGLK
jgi:uncharacterized protein YdeI (YjbR/CyaY-like superfamily)